MNIFDLQATISLNGDAFMSGVQNASTAFGSLGKTVGAGAVAVGNIVGGMVTSAASDLKGFGRDVIATGMDFDAAMSNVKAISGATGDEFEALRQKALEMGASTKFTATEAAEAFSYMAMAGWSASDMLDGIEGIMNLAAASGESLATTSDIVTDALTAFGLSASDSGHFADVLAAASASANTNVGMMGETFKYVAPVAGALNYSIEDVATAIGTMANSGVKASMAGTALRSALTALVKPSEDAWGVLDKLDLVALADGAEDFEADLTLLEDEMHAVETKTDALAKAQEKYNAAVEKYGESSTQALTALSKVESATYNLQKAEAKLQSGKDEQMREEYQYTTLLQNSDGTMKDLSQTVDTLREAFANLDEKKQAEYASTLFGQRAMSGMLAIINSTEEEYGALAGTIGASSDAMDGAGAAAEMAQTQLDNLQGDVTILSSAFDGFKQALFANAEEPLRNLAQIGSGVFSDLTASINEDGLGGALANLGTIIATNLAPHLEGLEEKFAPIKELFSGAIAGAAEKFSGAVEQVGEAMGAAAGALETFADTIKNRADFPGILDGIAEGAKKLFDAFLSAKSDIIGSVAGAVAEFLEGFADSGAAAAIGDLAASVGDFLAKFLTVGADVVSKIASAVKKFLSGFDGFEVGKGFGDFVASVGDLFSVIATVSAETLEKISKSMGSFVDAFDFEGIGEGASSVITVLESIATNATSGIAGDLEAESGALSDFGAAVAGFAASLGPAISTILQGIATFVGKLAEMQAALDAAFAPIREFFGNTLLALLTAALSAISSVLSNIGLAFSEWVSAMKHGADMIKSIFSGDLHAAFNDLLNAAVDTCEGIVALFGGIVDAAVALAGDMWSAGHNLISSLWEGMKSVITSVTSWVSGAMSGIVSTVKDIFKIGSPSKVFKEIGKNTVLGFGIGWESEFGDLERDVERDMSGLTKTAQIGFDASAIGKSSAAGISSMLAVGEFGGGRSGEPVEINLVLDGDVAATALYDPLRHVAWQKGRGTEELAYA